METIKGQFPDVNKDNVGVGSTIYAVKPGDGSAREQAASCQKVLGSRLHTRLCKGESDKRLSGTDPEDERIMHHSGYRKYQLL